MKDTYERYYCAEIPSESLLVDEFSDRVFFTVECEDDDTVVLNRENVSNLIEQLQQWLDKTETIEKWNMSYLKSKEEN